MILYHFFNHYISFPYPAWSVKDSKSFPYNNAAIHRKNIKNTKNNIGLIRPLLSLANG